MTDKSRLNLPTVKWVYFDIKKDHLMFVWPAIAALCVAMFVCLSVCPPQIDSIDMATYECVDCQLTSLVANENRYPNVVLLLNIKVAIQNNNWRRKSRKRMIQSSWKRQIGRLFAFMRHFHDSRYKQESSTCQNVLASDQLSVRMEDFPKVWRHLSI